MTAKITTTPPPTTAIRGTDQNAGATWSACTDCTDTGSGSAPPASTAANDFAESAVNCPWIWVRPVVMGSSSAGALTTCVSTTKAVRVPMLAAVIDHDLARDRALLDGGDHE